MQASDRPKFVEVMHALSTSCRHTLTDMQVELYWLGLKDVPLSGFTVAAGKLVGGRWFPSAEEIRAALPGAQKAEDRSHAAWAQVLSAVQAYGYTSSVDFEDKAINAAVASMGGWIQLCQSDPDWMLRFAPAQFKKLYVSYASNGVPAELGRALTGHRFDIMPAPVLVPVATRKQLASGSEPRALPARPETSTREILGKLAAGADGKARDFLERAARKEGT